MIDHATGTTAKIYAAGIDYSAAMALSQSAMGLINHMTGDVNAIFGGDGEGGVGGWLEVIMGKAIWAAMVG